MRGYALRALAKIRARQNDYAEAPSHRQNVFTGLQLKDEINQTTPLIHQLQDS